MERRAWRFLLAARVLGTASTVGLLALALCAKWGLVVPAESTFAFTFGVAYLVALLARLFAIYYAEQAWDAI